jgi:hypothetical protein
MGTARGVPRWCAVRVAWESSVHPAAGATGLTVESPELEGGVRVDAGFTQRLNQHA